MLPHLGLLLAALAGASHATEPACERFVGAPRHGVMQTMTGGFLVYALNGDANPADAMTLQLKGTLARHLAGGRADARVALQGAVRLPSLECDGASVHRLLVSRAEVSFDVPVAVPGDDPRQALAALEATRAVRALDRAELERLRQLYWTIGDTAKAQEIARMLFTAR